MRLLALFTPLLLLVLSGCSSTDVVTDYNPRADFSRYERYIIADTSGADKTVSPFVVDNVKESLQRQLKAGLYTLADTPANANFLVRYYVAEAAETIDRSPRLGLGFGSFGGNFGIGTSVGVPLGKDKINRNIQIIIDLLNPADNKLTWRGSLVVELNDRDPKVNANTIERAVTEIWSQFPPA
ncbi:DUF4136 domain-containing protein [Zhongshania aquimaris]|uniref:DUF4136 domain-containing protein n=1 Tax=Zhongshania aquimaris TaxID=2857107 RepID=A0ABS6VRE7_9GAMM|nr:DUF4136 domain-containing protein [Zhongshania aquimaris]MBW2940330.1 DUF4136 domain-containing protein [Zhongshania aquimaris]